MANKKKERKKTQTMFLKFIVSKPVTPVLAIFKNNSNLKTCPIVQTNSILLWRETKLKKFFSQLLCIYFDLNLNFNFAALKKLAFQKYLNTKWLGTFKYRLWNFNSVYMGAIIIYMYFWALISNFNYATLKKWSFLRKYHNKWLLLHIGSLLLLKCIFGRWKQIWVLYFGISQYFNIQISKSRP